jgi:ubiquinol-cytochrome c reductase cytochrome b subunit
VFARLRGWLVHRFGLRPIYDNFLLRRVPKDPWYAGDGMAMLLLMTIQIVTGMFLALSYSPSVDSAYQSVRYITHQQFLGGFVRGMHYWSGGLWVVILVWHLFRQLLIGGYKEPREGTWLLGVVLFFLVITMSFLGYALRWDERAVYGIKVSLNHFYRVPWIGEHLVMLVQGGPELGTLTLTRFYAMHVIILPMLLVGLATYHVYLIVLRGTVPPTEKEKPIYSVEQQKRVYKQDAHSEERGEMFYPTTQVRLSHMPLLAFFSVLALTLTLGPAPLFPEANLTERSFPYEEWWFAWYSSLAAQLPPGWASIFYVGFPIALFVVLILLPFVDRGPYRGMKHRPVAIAVVVGCAIALFYLSGLRRQSPWTAWPSDVPPSVPAGIVLNEGAERGRVLFAQYGCNTCHAIAGDGPPFGPDLAALEQRYSRSEIRQWILQPPADVPMPGYAGRISEEDLERIVEFVHVAQTFPQGQ